MRALSASAVIHASPRPGSVQFCYRESHDHHEPFATNAVLCPQTRYYLALFPAFAEMTKVRNCDLVISTSHAVAKAMVHASSSRPLHVCYIHSPMRYVWDRFEQAP